MATKKKAVRKKTVAAKLASLRKTGRKIAKKVKVKPYFFSGKVKSAKKKVVRKKAKAARRVVAIAREENTIKGVKPMARKKTARKARRVRRLGFDGLEMLGTKRKAKRRTARKAAPKRHRRRSARMGGEFSPKGIIGALTSGAGVVGGAVVGSFISKKLPIADGRIKALISIVGGAILSTMKPVKKHAIGRNAALGLIAIGAINLLKQFPATANLLAGEEMLGMEQLTAQEQAMLGYSDSDLMGASMLGQDFQSPADIS